MVVGKREENKWIRSEDREGERKKRIEKRNN